ncbi:MAG: ATP-binding protein [Verrucomicrobiota bacterium]|jgi:signal transduction histidine kinase
MPCQLPKLKWLLVGQLALLLALPLQGQQPSLTNASQLNGLSAAEAAKGRPVKLRGTLTHYKPEWNGLFLQDETGAFFVQRSLELAASATNLQPGQIIEVTGKTKPGAIHCDVLATALRVVGTGPLPSPLDLSVTNLCSVENERLRVKATGQIFSIGDMQGRPQLHLGTTAGLFLNVDCKSASFPEVQALRGSLIQFEGVLCLELTPQKRHTGRFDVLVTGMDAIHKIKSVPIIPISELVADGQPARIRAVVEEARPGSLLVRDSSGVVSVNYNDKPAFSRDAAVDVLGYPVRDSAGLVMTRANVSVPMSGNPALPVLNRIARIRDLSAPQAARGFPVQIDGVVTFNDPDLSLQFVQDGTAGIYVSMAVKRFDVFPAAGARIELLGFTGPGEFAPVIEAEELRVVGPGRYPDAAPAPFQLLMTGAEDSQWVELNGVVRSAATTSNRTLVVLSTGDALIQITVLDVARPAPTNLVGASIAARGVCRTLFDDHRHFQAMSFCVPGWDQVQVQEEEVAAPFQLPLRPVNGLFEFHAGGYGLNRAHVRGRIILRQRGGAFFMQDDSGGILVHSDASIPTTDWVEVVGFPALKDQLPVLQDALVRPAAPHPPPPAPPTRLSPDSPLDKALNATVVTLEGRVVAYSSRTTEESVTVQFGQWFIDAIMERSDLQPLPRFLPGSVVRLTGVFVARLDDNRQIRSFQILLRSPADALVISVPPWWTARHALLVFGGLGAVLLLSLAWVAALRQQVRRRTAQLRAEIEERKRMEAQVKKTHRELMEISRHAGMAEVATSVLHNVGNILNSVNVSGSIITQTVKQSKLARLNLAVGLLRDHASTLGDFLTNDPKGRQLPVYFSHLADELALEHKEMLRELHLLGGNIDHIKEIVAMQQNYAKVSNLRESLPLAELIEDALRLDLEDLTRHHIQIQREYETLPPIEVEKHKVLQILVNLVQNAKHSLIESGHPDKRLTLRVGGNDGRLVRIAIIDNGLGIAPENLTRIFAHGFTTRKDGHGFGLHGGALAAREMGGSLTAFSDGPGTGAAFTLDLPLLPIARCQPVTDY